MEGPVAVVHERVHKECSELVWLHDRTLVHVPIAASAFAMCESQMNTEYAQFYGALFAELGAQPIVLRAMPPLMHLLIYGCGCAKCTRSSADVDATGLETPTAYQVLQFYFAVLSKRAYGTQSKADRESIRHDSLVRVCMSSLRAMQAARLTDPAANLVPLLQELHDKLSADIADDAAVLLFHELALAFATQPGYTVCILTLVEAFVWGALSKSATKEVGQLPDALQTSMWLCKPLSESDAVRAEMSRTAEHQSANLRTLFCRDEDKGVLSARPDFRVPSHDVVVRVMDPLDSPDAQSIPMRSAFYSALALYVAWLGDPAKDAPPLAPQDLASVQHVDSPVVVAEQQATASV